MSTIRAKQQICLNISTVRSFSSYTVGRFCLRFSLWEVYNSSASSESHLPEHRYAVPVSVVEYKTQPSTGAPNPAYEISDCYYQTKPFILKSGMEVPIHEICIFKHDINVFNSHYEADFHELAMKCRCELVSYDYSGEDSKVVSTFDGRIRGIGISDSLVIDFWEGTSCQVIGSAHNCVYQFQYLYTGQHGRRDSGIMKDSINVENYHQMMVVNTNGTGHRRSVEAMNFEKYCELQSREYVESLLEYLLSEVKKSDEKITTNLGMFEQISQKPTVPVVQFEAPAECEEEYSLQLEKSIRNQSQLEAESIIDEEMKQRLSILKAESKYYCADDEQGPRGDNPDLIDQDGMKVTSEKVMNSNAEKDEKKQQDEEYICIVLDSDQQEVVEKLPTQSRYKTLVNQEKANTSSSPSTESMGLPSRIFHPNPRNQRIDNYEEGPADYQEQLYSNKIAKIKDRKSGKPKNEEQMRGEKDPESAQAQKREEDARRKNTKRRKIFLHSNMDPNETSQLEQLELQNRVSVYEARFIPSSVFQCHPSNHASNSHKKEKEGPTSRVTIEQFQKMLHSKCLNIYEKWRKFIAYLAQPEGTLLVNAYKAEYRKKLEAHLGQSVIRFKGSLDVDMYSNEQSQRNKMAYQIRSQVSDNQKNMMINQFRFYSKGLFSTKKPIMFQQKFEQAYHSQPEGYSKQAPKKSFLKVSLSANTSRDQSHIIFLVHGLGACRLDMERLKIEIKRNFKQKVYVVCSCSNEGRTEGNIDLMGVRLAHEVEQEIAKNFGSFEGLEKKELKISFIGHSMGGIIIRSALPRLEKFKNFFNSFVSLSSPHLGYCYSSSKLIDAGLWLINNWQKCESILQLTMADTPKSPNQKVKFNMQDTFLYKLSLQKGLEWFKKLTFLASRQDLYVPYFSARIQKHEECINDLKHNNPYAVLHSKMVDNILSRVTGSVSRIDVNFCITEQNIDNLIGRAAHINFVSSVDFLQLLCVTDEPTLI